MLCCLGNPSEYAPLDGSGVSAYPGQRRQCQYQEPTQQALANTGGNALMAFDPSSTQSTGGHIVSVTVPEGVAPGQTIHVAAPDGSDQLVAAVIPQGMEPGATFIVEFPPVVPQGYTSTNSSSNTNGVPFVNPVGSKTEQTPSPTDIINQDLTLKPAVANPLFVHDHQSVSEPQCNSDSDKLLLVKVPPGTAPGATINVQPPGENFTVSAVVPPNTSEFHVSYTPTQRTVDPSPPLPSPPLIPPTIQEHPTNAPKNRVLVLVKVPPGTAAGTTIHVQVPGENRMIAAVVPPNVNAFHVSCTPKNKVETSTSDHRNTMSGQMIPTWNQNGITPATPPMSSRTGSTEFDTGGHSASNYHGGNNGGFSCNYTGNSI